MEPRAPSIRLTKIRWGRPSSSSSRSMGAASGARAGSGSTTTIARSASARARAPSAWKPVPPGTSISAKFSPSQSKVMRLSSVDPPRARASGLKSPTLLFAAVSPCRSIVPLANSIASARQVLPAPAGPTSAMALVPLTASCRKLADCMVQLSFVPGLGRVESLQGASRAREAEASACPRHLASPRTRLWSPTCRALPPRYGRAVL